MESALVNHGNETHVNNPANAQTNRHESVRGSISALRLTSRCQSLVATFRNMMCWINLEQFACGWSIS